MEKIYDVTALGEMLIDFAVNGESEQGNQLFEACPGGAPCNVLAMLNKLGRKTAFIGKVGDDQFGISFIRAVDSEHTEIEQQADEIVGMGNLLGGNPAFSSPVTNPCSISFCMIEVLWANSLSLRISIRNLL